MCCRSPLASFGPLRHDAGEEPRPVVGILGPPLGRQLRARSSSSVSVRVCRGRRVGTLEVKHHVANGAAPMSRSASAVGQGLVVRIALADPVRDHLPEGGAGSVDAPHYGGAG